ncbi:MAG TPA: DUF4920 domain-containing protein [Vicinamibacterales bacterium]|nr:DUF4920 domain-containing protein [Vicinamibacterales bacterium]
MKTLLAATLVALSLPGLAEVTKLGAGVSLDEATPIRDVVARPEEFVGRTIRIDGVATAVCTHMGCWMGVAPEGDDQAPTVRVKVDDGVIVFPVSAKGKKVSAQGVLEAVGGSAEAREAAGEHAKADPNASQQYQLKATGALIR